jgi:hypothetical protein
MRVVSLTNDEKAATGGFTHRIDFSFRDIPAGVALNTAQTFTTLPNPQLTPLPKLALGDIVKECHMHLVTPFANTADAAFNTSTVSLGLVTGGVAALIAATETNLNGANVLDTIPGVGTPVVPFKNATANNGMTLTINAMAAKTVSSLNQGQLYILIALQRGSDQSTVKAPPWGTGYV